MYRRKVKYNRSRRKFHLTIQPVCYIFPHKDKSVTFLDKHPKVSKKRIGKGIEKIPDLWYNENTMEKTAFDVSVVSSRKLPPSGTFPKFSGTIYENKGVVGSGYNVTAAMVSTYWRFLLASST